MTNVVLERPPASWALLAKAAIKRAHKQSVVTLPDTTILLREQVASNAFVEAYHHLTGWQNSQYMHPCLPWVMAFPLQLQLMLQPAFPFRLIGMVHLHNHIQQYAPIDISQPLSIAVCFGALTPHDKGQLVSVVTEVRAKDSLLWQANSQQLVRVFSSPSTTCNKEQSQASKPQLPQLQWPVHEKWQWAASTGRRYARVSGDYNPIHLYGMTARFLGFKRQIAHGMFAKAKALTSLTAKPTACDVKVSFKRPVLLPARIQLVQQQQAFALVDESREQVHLSGELT